MGKVNWPSIVLLVCIAAVSAWLFSAARDSSYWTRCHGLYPNNPKEIEACYVRLKDQP